MRKLITFFTCSPLFLLAILGSFGLSVAEAKEWSGIFSGGKGTRLDFTPQDGGLKTTDESSTYLYRFDIPAEGTKAILVLLSRKASAKTESREIYEMEILQRSDEMVVMKIILQTTEQVDRFQLFSVFPKSGIGFCTTVSAYITGTKEFKALGTANPKIPPASTNTVSFFRVE